LPDGGAVEQRALSMRLLFQVQFVVAPPNGLLPPSIPLKVHEHADQPRFFSLAALWGRPIRTGNPEEGLLDEVQCIVS